MVAIGMFAIIFQDELLALAENAFASHDYYGVSATCYRRAEDIRVVPIIIAPLKLCDIQRQVLAADFVETSHDAALQERPKTVDRLSVNSAVDILASTVPHGPVLSQFAISGIFVGRDQADFFRGGFTNKAVQRLSVGMFDDAGHDIAIALYRADNGVFAFSAGPWRALIPMPVSVLATNISFINFDNAIANSEKEKAREEDCTAACGRCRSIRDERRRSTDDRSGSERIRRF